MSDLVSRPNATGFALGCLSGDTMPPATTKEKEMSEHFVNMKPYSVDKRITGKGNTRRLCFSVGYHGGNNIFGQRIGCFCIVMAKAEKWDGKWCVEFELLVDDGVQCIGNPGPTVGFYENIKTARAVLTMLSQREWTYDLDHKELLAPPSASDDGYQMEGGE